MAGQRDKILILIGTGRLSDYLVTDLEKKYGDAARIVQVSRKECNITSRAQVYDLFKLYEPDIFIHTAAMTNPMQAHEENPAESIQVNIVGTANIASICAIFKTKMVYISTDYVYPGFEGPHGELDPVLPFCNYGRSKLGGEMAVQMLSDHLIFRASFTPVPFKHDKVVADVKKNMMYINEASDKMATLIVRKFCGVINIGGDETDPYKFATETSPGREFTKISRRDITSYILPMDTTMKLDTMKTCTSDIYYKLDVKDQPISHTDA